ncbi:MAG: peptidase, partial [Ignavibacteriaceae bacterium]|nr:peptidase [Ignavibacteriaceae bacterium]
MKYLIYSSLILSLVLFGCEKQTEQSEEMTMTEQTIAKFVPTELKYDSSNLDENQKMVIQKIYEASKIMDEIFLEQVYSRNNEIKAQLMAQDTEEAKEQLELFNIMFGPFDRLDHDAPFIGTEKKPL